VTNLQNSWTLLSALPPAVDLNMGCSYISYGWPEALPVALQGCW